MGAAVVGGTVGFSVALTTTHNASRSERLKKHIPKNSSKTDHHPRARLSSRYPPKDTPERLFYTFSPACRYGVLSPLSVLSILRFLGTLLVCLTPNTHYIDMTTMITAAGLMAVSHSSVLSGKLLMSGLETITMKSLELTRKAVSIV